MLDAAPLAEKLAEAGLDLTPRALPPLEFEVVPTQTDFSGFVGIAPELLANLALAVVDGGEKTALVIGDEARSRRARRVLAAAERLRLTFSTPFYEAHPLRSLFVLVTVRSRAEAPSQRESYAVFDLEAGEFPQLSPALSGRPVSVGAIRALLCRASEEPLCGEIDELLLRAGRARFSLKADCLSCIFVSPQLSFGVRVLEFS